MISCCFHTSKAITRRIAYDSPSRYTSSSSKKRADRRSQIRALRNSVRTATADLNERISQLELEWEQEDAENQAYNQVRRIFNKILTPELINQVAVKTGFQKRHRQIQPIAIIAILMMGCLSPKVDTLKIMCHLLKKWYKVIIKPQSLQNCIERKEAYNFIKEIQEIIFKYETNRVLKKLKQRKSHSHIERFNEILLQDSTVISLPETMWRVFKGCGGSASKAAIKIDVIFDLNEPCIKSMEFYAGKVPDGNTDISENILRVVGNNDLVIRDLGYFNIKQLIKIENSLAFFISRLSKSINVYKNKDDEDPLDLIKFIEDLGINEKEIDITVYLGKDERFPVRLVAIKVPPEVIEARRQQYKRSNGNSKEPSESLAEWNGYTFMITNIPKEEFSHHMILKLYKIRWQIELLFKNFKSNLNIDNINGKKKYRILCLLNIKILLAWIVTLICSYAQTLIDKEVSFFQVTCWLLRVGDFNKALATRNIELLLDELPIYIGDLCKQQTQTKKSSLQEVQHQLLQEVQHQLENENIKNVA